MGLSHFYHPSRSLSNLAVISVATYLHEFDSYVYYWMSTRLRLTRLHLRRVRQP